MDDQPFDPYHRACPSRRLLNHIGELWTVLVVGALAEGPMRYSEIAQRVDGVSQKMLTQTLRNLERDGLLSRTQYAEIPPRVVYELTPTGHDLVVPLRALEDWTIGHMAEVLSARQEYDARIS
jgi:DNA-binding HxlR family transcriptional regulator